VSDEDVGRRPTRIFLSYAFEDSIEARRVARSLGDADFNIWLNEWHLTPGEDLDQAIGDAIRSSDKLVVLLSPHSVASPWVRSELEQALSARLDRRDIDLIPALLAPCDVPEDLRARGIIDLTQDNPAGLQELIDRLRYSKAIDFRLLDHKSFERLVADLLGRLGFGVEPEWRARPDRDIDIKAAYQHEDPFGAIQETVYFVEIKFYPHERASVRGLQQLSMYLGDAPGNVRGLLVTNGLLTSEARGFLEDENLPIMERLSVLDGRALRRLLSQHPDLIDRYFPVNSEPTGSGGSDS
jgi:TIR domain/Restriction endonuclease